MSALSEKATLTYKNLPPTLILLEARYAAGRSFCDTRHSDCSEFRCLITQSVKFLVFRRIEISLQFFHAFKGNDGDPLRWLLLQNCDRLRPFGQEFSTRVRHQRGSFFGPFDKCCLIDDVVLRDHIHWRFGLSMETLNGNRTKPKTCKHRQACCAVGLHGFLRLLAIATTAISASAACRERRQKTLRLT